MGELGKRLFAAICLIGALVAHAQAQGEENQACPHADRWKPIDDELKQILEAHRQWLEELDKDSSFSTATEWAEQHPQGRAYLCKAELRGVDLTNANLRR